MEHYIALYEAKIEKKVAAADLPFLLEHLNQTFREHLDNSETPNAVVKIPARYVLMCIGSWYKNWSNLKPLKDLGTRSLNDLPVKSSQDFGLKLHRTPGQHNIHEHISKEIEKHLRETMERYQRTVQWVNAVIRKRYLTRGPKFPVPNTYVCETCIYCFPNLDNSC